MNPDDECHPLKPESNQGMIHPIYQLSFDDDLWAQRIIYENAYAHAYKRRFGSPPTTGEAFQMSYMVQVMQQMLNAKIEDLGDQLQEGFERRLQRMEAELKKYMDEPIGDDDIDHSSEPNFNR